MNYEIKKEIINNYFCIETIYIFEKERSTLVKQSWVPSDSYKDKRVFTLKPAKSPLI